MAQIFDRFKNWLVKRRDFLYSWTTRDYKETQEPEISLEELPSELRDNLITATKNLPLAPADKEAVISTLDETFAKWRSQHESADNSIVIVSSPVTSVSRVMAEGLEDWAKERQIPIELLFWTARPDNIEAIASELERELKLENSATDSESLKIAVIPNLGWCFLRSIEGLSGIDYLRSMLLRDRSRFWIIGAGLVCWEYLDLVTNFDAYCGKVCPLPRLEGKDLKAWLNHIFSEFEISFAKPSLDSQLLDGDKSLEDRYFDKLASVSDGVSVVAVQVFLRSLGYKTAEEIEQERDRQDEQDEKLLPSKELEKIIPDALKEKAKAATNKAEESSQSTTEASKGKKILLAKTPKLPDLPDLDSEEHYVLYSLLLHGEMTLSALTESLGDEEYKVRAQVQILRRAGIVEERNQILQVNPIYYPKLKRELASNNFVISDLNLD